MSCRHVGLLRYARARGVVSLAVRYSTWGHRILVRVPAYSDAGPFLDGADVALDVDAGTNHGSRVVRVAGIAIVVSDSSTALAETQSVSVAAEPLTTIVLIPETVNWLPQVDDVRYPPLPNGAGRMPATFAG
ncbi:MAG: hypothetical protein QM650_02455 [Microlunatus sp.]